MNTPTVPIQKNNTTFLVLIGILSVAIPFVVAVLFYMDQDLKSGGFDLAFLPRLNAILNSSVAIALLFGFYFIKVKKNKRYHVTAMISAFVLSSLFLISYVTYHILMPNTKFGDLDGNGIVTEVEKAAAGGIAYFYYFVLLTHILLAIVIVPLVLLSIYFGISKQYQKHTRIVKYTFPIWLYVSVTGVIVYLLISPYYKH